MELSKSVVLVFLVIGVVGQLGKNILSVPMLETKQMNQHGIGDGSVVITEVYPPSGSELDPSSPKITFCFDRANGTNDSTLLGVDWCLLPEIYIFHEGYGSFCLCYDDDDHFKHGCFFLNEEGTDPHENIYHCYRKYNVDGKCFEIEFYPLEEAKNYELFISHRCMRGSFNDGPTVLQSTTMAEGWRIYTTPFSSPPSIVYSEDDFTLNEENFVVDEVTTVDDSPPGHWKMDMPVLYEYTPGTWVFDFETDTTETFFAHNTFRFSDDIYYMTKELVFNVTIDEEAATTVQATYVKNVTNRWEYQSSMITEEDDLRYFDGDLIERSLVESLWAEWQSNSSVHMYTWLLSGDYSQRLDSVESEILPSTYPTVESFETANESTILQIRYPDSSRNFDLIWTRDELFSGRSYWAGGLHNTVTRKMCPKGSLRNYKCPRCNGSYHGLQFDYKNVYVEYEPTSHNSAQSSHFSIHHGEEDITAWVFNGGHSEYEIGLDSLPYRILVPFSNLSREDLSARGGRGMLFVPSAIVGGDSGDIDVTSENFFGQTDFCDKNFMSGAQNNIAKMQRESSVSYSSFLKSWKNIQEVEFAYPVLWDENTQGIHPTNTIKFKYAYKKHFVWRMSQSLIDPDLLQPRLNVTTGLVETYDDFSKRNLTYTIKNNGELEGNFSVKFFVNGSLEKDEGVFLMGNGTNLNFNFTLNGTYLDDGEVNVTTSLEVKLVGKPLWTPYESTHVTNHTLYNRCFLQQVPQPMIDVFENPKLTHVHVETVAVNNGSANGQIKVQMTCVGEHNLTYSKSEEVTSGRIIHFVYSFPENSSGVSECTITYSLLNQWHCWTLGGLVFQQRIFTANLSDLVMESSSVSESTSLSSTSQDSGSASASSPESSHSSHSSQESTSGSTVSSDVPSSSAGSSMIESNASISEDSSSQIVLVTEKITMNFGEIIHWWWIFLGLLPIPHVILLVGMVAVFVRKRIKLNAAKREAFESSAMEQEYRMCKCGEFAKIECKDCCTVFCGSEICWNFAHSGQIVPHERISIVEVTHEVEATELEEKVENGAN